MRRLFPWLSSLLMLALLFSLGAFPASLVAAQEGNNSEDVSAGDILNDPDGFAGETVTTSGMVDGELDREAFTLEANGEELLVVGDRGTIPSDVPDEVEVTGTVEENFDIADVEDELGVRLNDRQLNEFSGEPYIMAENVRERTSDSQSGNGDTGSTSRDRVGVGLVVDDYDRYLMQQLTIAGQVEDIISETSMMISAGEESESGAEMLVFANDQAIPAELNEDAIVEVSGTLYIFDPEDADLISGLDEEDINFDTDNDLYSDYYDRPVLVANSVRLLVPSLGGTIDFILDDPADYIGGEVNLYGRVADDYALSGFTLEGTDSLFGGEDLMVVGAEDVLSPLELETDAIVNVRGTVYWFDPVELEDEEDVTIDEDDEAFSGLDEGDPVVVADTVNLLSLQTGEAVEDILENTDDYIGLTVGVAGNINEVLTDQSFTFEGTSGFLGIGGDDLLVIGAQNSMPTEALNDDVVVWVMGTLYYYDPVEIEDQEDVDFDEDNDAFSDFDDGDPVIVATRVIPLVVTEDN